LVEVIEQRALAVLLPERLTPGPEQFTVSPFGEELPAKLTVPVKLNVLVRVALTERSVRPMFMSIVTIMIV